MARLCLLLAALAGFTGVALGAFAAHGLKGRLTADYLAVFQTGTHYQLIHALALFGVALWLHFYRQYRHVADTPTTTSQAATTMVKNATA